MKSSPQHYPCSQMSYHEYALKEKEKKMEEAEREEMRRRLPKGGVELEKVVMD